MKNIDKYRLRKCTDINMELPFFEVLDEENVAIMDVSKTDDGKYQILFYDGCSSRKISVDILETIIREAKTLIDKEEE